MRLLIGIAIGIGIGVVGYWIYAHRDVIGLAYNNRDRLSAGGKLLSDAQAFWETL